MQEKHMSTLAKLVNDSIDVKIAMEAEIILAII